MQVTIREAREPEHLGISELSCNKTKEVSGGVAPVVAAAVSIAMNATVRTFAGAIISRGMAIYSVYGAAVHYGGSGGGGGARRRNSYLTSKH
ncbi:MAG: hypothetical protein AAF662_15550 [Pseudomonadota bacterium]